MRLFFAEDKRKAKRKRDLPMGFALLPLAAILFFVGIITVEQTYSENVAPSGMVANVQWEAQSFVAYRNAVSAYVQSNPSFIGEIPAAMLDASFSEEFLALAGNQVNATASGIGRVMTSYAALKPDAMRVIRLLTQNDSSIQVAANGNVISVIQAGV